jgi:hypothetical protein
MPQPTEAHRRLERIAGTWVGEEKIHPTPWDPAGGAAVGRAQNRVALDGFALVQDYEQERDGRVNFRGHGVMRWDPARQHYAMHWFDSSGVPPSEFRGQFDGDVLTLTCAAPQGHSRAVWDFREPDAYHFRMEVSPDGNQWTPFMEGRYARQG